MPDDFSILREQISRLPASQREKLKGKILLENPGYLAFLRALTFREEDELRLIESEFREDLDFFDIFLPRIQVLEGLENAGDLRFHSFTLYALVRALRPSLVVETGVAHGKSSALILLALSHNGQGRLVSFDLPPSGDLADGSKTSLSGRQVGWIVPKYLRTSWELNLVDSVAGLRSMFISDPHFQPDRLQSLERVDLFFHDSLHTYDHILAELEAVNRSLSANFLIVADNLEMESGLGFETFCQRQNLKVETFGNLGGCRRAASNVIN